MGEDEVVATSYDGKPKGATPLDVFGGVGCCEVLEDGG